ncbi:MAG: DUF58 domain-containing protein [bacterium]
MLRIDRFRVETLFAPINQYFDRWLSRRTPVVESLTLNHQKLYILPTRSGGGFILLIAALWLMATNYENNLAFLVCFLLLALFVVSIHFTHANLSGLTIRAVRAQSVFPGEQSAIELCISQPRPKVREQILLRFPGEDVVSVDLNNAGDTFITLLARGKSRGWLQPGRLIVESHYPVGLFRVWTYIRFQIDAVVYPLPVESTVASRGRGGKREGFFSGGGGSEEYTGLSKYQSGESLKHVAWKQYAREQGLWSKRYADPVSDNLWIDWDNYGGLDREQRLSRMAWQACDCHDRGIPFGLRLPGQSVKPGQGQIHFAAILRHLALFEAEQNRAN